MQFFYQVFQSEIDFYYIQITNINTKYEGIF